ncbi:MAG: molybdenum cofactor biosynthesis protein B [Salinivirgaceae bacterium]
MKVNTIYRITSHKQHVEVDDVSTSPHKVSKQVLIFEDLLPEPDVLKSFTGETAVGTILVLDAFDKEPFNPFDAITGAESNLQVVKTLAFNGITGVLCLPEDYQTFYIGQDLIHLPKLFTARVVTLSDRAHRGIYEDKSGPLIVEELNRFFDKANKKVAIKHTIIPDNADELGLILEECKIGKTDLLITTGGTGIGKRDITVETVRMHMDKEIPGIMDMIRLKYGAEKPNALLSRSIAGTMNQTLFYTLPGSPKACEEYLSEIFKTLDHLFYMIHGFDVH